MLKQVRQDLINNLWERYCAESSQMRRIEDGLRQRNAYQIHLDHFALIDLPGPHTGISVLRELFAKLGYVVQGMDYLPDKQNDFCWMAEHDSINTPVRDVLPQVVVADFRLEEMPTNVRNIIVKYARLAPPSPLDTLSELVDQLNKDASAGVKLNKLLTHYLSGRDWPLPSVSEFHQVHEFNELLAWVLVFGRKPNHFTLSAHLLPTFSNLSALHDFIEQSLQLELNYEGNVIKGCKNVGIEQGSTAGSCQPIALADGTVNIPTDFIEFVWRFPADANNKNPTLWNDYFTGFIAQHANQVIESLYE